MSYESGGKCGKLLARSVKGVKSASYIPQITFPDGQKATIPMQISKGFGNYYSDLYNLPSSTSKQANIDKYISDSQLPSLPLETQEILEKPITIEQLKVAIGSMKVGKAPGPDGYTAQYYKTFLPILGPHMVTFFNALGSYTNFPRDTLRAHISLIHKEGGTSGSSAAWSS